MVRLCTSLGFASAPWPTSDSGVQFPRKPHNLQNPNTPQGITVRPNLLKFAATMNPRVLFQISSLYTWDSAALRPAALLECHGITANPESSHLSGLCDPRTPKAKASDAVPALGIL